MIHVPEMLRSRALCAVAVIVALAVLGPGFTAAQAPELSVVDIRFHRAAEALVSVHRRDEARPRAEEQGRYYRRELEAAASEGADVDSVDGQGRTVLYKFQELEFESPAGIALVDLVLDLGATVDFQLEGRTSPGGPIRSAGGRTALMRAVEVGALPFVELLISRGADPTLDDALGCSAICRSLIGAQLGRAGGFRLNPSEYEELAARLAGSPVRLVAERFELWRTWTLPRKIPNRKKLIELLAFYGLPGLPLLVAILVVWCYRLARKTVKPRPILRSLLAGWVATLVAMRLSSWLGDVLDMGSYFRMFVPLIWPVVSIVGLLVAVATYLFNQRLRGQSRIGSR